MEIQAEDPPYVDKVYKALKDNLVGFDKTPEQFKVSMTDAGYAAKAYSALRENLIGFNKSQDDFYGDLGIKKKADTAVSGNTSNPFQNGSNPFPITQKPIEYSMASDPKEKEQIAHDTLAHQQPIAQSSDKGSWGNLPTFGAREVFGGLEKDLGNLFGFAKDKLGKLPGLAGVGAKEMMAAAQEFEQKAQKNDENIAATNQLPNTTAGHVASTITKFIPDVIELAATPELDLAKLGKLGEYVAKGGKYVTKGANMAVGKFPIQQATKNMLQDYSDVKENGGDESQANTAALQGFAKGYKNGLIFEGAGAAAGKLTDLGKGALERSGLMAGNKLVAGAEKRLLHATAQGITFSAAPILQNAVEGKGTDLNEIKQNGIFGAVLGGLTGHHVDGEPTYADKAAAQVLMRKPLVDLHNFTNADIGDIQHIHNLDISSADMQANSIAHAEDGFEEDDPHQKAYHVLQSSLWGNASSIKSVTNAILKDKQGVIDEVNQMDLPEEAKQPIIDKINQVHKELDPIEQQKTAIGTHISDIDEQIKALPKEEADPVKSAEKEVKLEGLTKQREELTNGLKKLITDQNDHKEPTGEVLPNEGKPEADKSTPPADEKSEDFEPSIAMQHYFDVALRKSPEMDFDKVKRQAIKNAKQEGREAPILEDFAYAVKKIGFPEDMPDYDETTENSQIKTTDNESTNEKVDAKESGTQKTSGQKENVAAKEEVSQSGTEEKSVPETIKPEVDDSREIKKKILTQRAYEGELSDDVKKHLEEKGLTRSSFSQEERSKQATDFINKFGEDAAYHAVKGGDIDGGLAASILTQLQIKNSRAIEDAHPDDVDELAKKQANYIDLLEKKGYLGGEFNGQLAHEYQNEELNYANVKRQVEKSTNKPITSEQEKKIKDLTDINTNLRKQVDDAEAKLIDESNKAFEAGKEDAKNETKAQRAKKIADKIRAGKIHRPGIFSSASPASLAWDTAVEITAKSVEAGGKLADAIEDGIKHIKSTDWYKNLSNNKQQQAEKEFKEHHQSNSGSTNLEDLQDRFLNKKDNKFSPNEAKDIWKYMRETYIDNGTSYRDAISKTSDDLGLTWRQISEAIITPKLKRASDEMWKRQADLARNRTVVKDWVADQNKSQAWKTIQKTSGLFRGVAVFGHGGIFVGTHAGMTLFNPATASKTIKAFFNGWKFAYGDEAKYERAMEELKQSPNYVIAQRAGLNNNPERMNAEEYQRSQKYLGKLGIAGEKGFNAIKILRQGLFDHYYERLSPAERDDPASLQSIAKLMNLATGATNLKLPSWVNEVTFAGGMEASRWGKLTRNPLKATETAIKAITSPDKVTTADKIFAKVWAKRVGTELATFTGGLIVNAALQGQLSPKNPVNLTNPNKPDFLKYKIGDLTIDPTSGMLGTASFMHKIGEIPFKDQKDLHGENRIKVVGKDAFGYARGKLSPMYSTIADVVSHQDYGGNTLPWNSDKPGKYAHKLKLPEYILSKAPLPIAEAVNIAYKSAAEHGANKPVLNDIMKGLISGAISGTTGFRVSETNNNKK